MNIVAVLKCRYFIYYIFFFGGGIIILSGVSMSVFRRHRIFGEGQMELSTIENAYHQKTISAEA